ncbi:hypothetical protein Tco_0782236, partial [Tanacetum coccineum]
MKTAKDLTIPMNASNLARPNMYAYPEETSIMTLPFCGSIRTTKPHHEGKNVKKKERMAPNELSENQKKDDEDERLLLIFKQIHINLPFLEAMIHMPKGAKVLKDLHSLKEKLEKAASSVKLSEQCSAIIQRSLPQKEGDPGSFTLPCLIGPLAVKNALADLGAINHDGKWTEDEEEEDSNKALAISFYLRTEPVEPLEWKALENRLTHQQYSMSLSKITWKYSWMTSSSLVVLSTTASKPGEDVKKVRGNQPCIELGKVPLH